MSCLTCNGMRPKNLHKKLDIPNFSLWSLEKSPLFHVPHYEVYKARSFLQVVFKQFNSLVQGIESLGLQNTKYRFLAADGSTCTYFSTPLFSSQDYYYSPEHSIKGIYSMHMRFYAGIKKSRTSPTLFWKIHMKFYLLGYILSLHSS